MSKRLYENTPLKREYEGYFKDQCEVWRHMPKESRSECKRTGYSPYGHIETHHIFHNIGRVDEWSNLICLSSHVHRAWGHSFHNRELTIVSLYAKWFKSQQPKNLLNPYPEDEFNLEELRYCLGKCPLWWLGNAMQNYDETDDYFQMCLEIRESY